MVRGKVRLTTSLLQPSRRAFSVAQTAWIPTQDKGRRGASAKGGAHATVEVPLHMAGGKVKVSLTPIYPTQRCGRKAGVPARQPRPDR